MIAIPTVQATKADVIQGAKALFAYRQSCAEDKNPRDRHPIMYRGYSWDKLPASEKAYYCDMAATVLQDFGIKTPLMAYESA